MFPVSSTCLGTFSRARGASRMSFCTALSGVKEQFGDHVMPTYARFDIMLDHGKGSYVYSSDGTKFLDAGGGIAVNSLGHAHPEIVRVVHEQASRLMHVSNLYYTENQAALAEKLSSLLGRGRVFFGNSGAEANEGLFKLARAHGAAKGRTEIVTAINSFHGRTLAGMAATGQDKISKGFGPKMPGFKHVPYNDIQAAKDAVDDKTAAILIEGIQGEGGVTPATPEYLLQLRQLCDEHGILLMLDSVQCGHFRSGRFQSYQRILDSHSDGDCFKPDAVSMAKSLGCGFPIGAFWAREPYADILSAGMHGSTYGGNPLGCAVALEGMKIIQRDKLDQNALELGQYISQTIITDIAARFPDVVLGVQGLGLMLGLKLNDSKNIKSFDSEQGAAVQMVQQLHSNGVLAVPAGTSIVRILPPLNFSKQEADDLLERLDSTAAAISK